MYLHQRILSNPLPVWQEFRIDIFSPAPLCPNKQFNIEAPGLGGIIPVGLAGSILCPLVLTWIDLLAAYTPKNLALSPECTSRRRPWYNAEGYGRTTPSTRRLMIRDKMADIGRMLAETLQRT